MNLQYTFQNTDRRPLSQGLSSPVRKNLDFSSVKVEACEIVSFHRVLMKVSSCGTEESYNENLRWLIQRTHSFIYVLVVCWVRTILECLACHMTMLLIFHNWLVLSLSTQTLMWISHLSKRSIQLVTVTWSRCNVFDRQRWRRGELKTFPDGGDLNQHYLFDPFFSSTHKQTPWMMSKHVTTSPLVSYEGILAT